LSRHTVRRTHRCLMLSWHRLSLPSFPTRRSSDLGRGGVGGPGGCGHVRFGRRGDARREGGPGRGGGAVRIREGGRAQSVRNHERSEEHTSELQSRENLVCRLLLEKKKKKPHRGRA